MDERLLLFWHVTEQDRYPLLTGFSIEKNTHTQILETMLTLFQDFIETVMGIVAR